MTSTLKPSPIESTLPEPKGYPIVGHALSYRLNPLEFYQQCATYGDFVRLRFGSHPVYFLNHPNLIKEVFITKANSFLLRAEGREAHFFAPIFGNGLSVSAGDFWRRQRHLVQPAFHRNQLATYCHLAVALTQQRIADWQDRDVFEVRDRMMRLNREIVTAITLGEDALTKFDTIEEVLVAAMTEYRNRERNWLLYLLPEGFPTPGNVRYSRATHALDEAVYHLINQRRHTSGDRSDILSVLIQMKDEHGQGMTDVELRDELVNVLVAHDNISDIFAWAWWLIAQHPEVEEKLVTEWHTVLDGRSPIAEDLPKLHYTEWVVLETLRLYPLAWITGRVATQDCDISGHTIHAGENVVMCQWVTHRDPRFFEQPDIFNPERWGNERNKQNHAYFPFGGGPRTCIGKGLTMMETVLLLATIGQRFQIQPLPHQTIIPHPGPSFSLTPKYGIKVQLIAR